MVRVAIDVGPLYGHRTGVGNAVGWLVDELEDRSEPDLLPYVTSTRARVVPPVRRLPLPAAAAHRLWARSSRPATDRWLGRPDVVHGTNYVVPPARCARVVSVYDCWFLDHPEQAGGDVRRAGLALRRAAGEGADVVTSSRASAERIRQLLGTTRVRPIHLGPPRPAGPPCRPRPGPGERPPDERLIERLTDVEFVLALGTIERRKNLPVLVAAFARLARELGEVVLVVAGAPGDAGDDLTAAVSRLDGRTAARVVRTGTVDEGTKGWLLAHATSLAYPSLDEGFGFPILEAQQAGTPVVASTAGSIPEVAGNAALLSGPDDTDALAANLHWVLTSDEMRTKLVARGNRNVARFTWRATADAYAAMYAELAEAGT